MNCSIGRLSDFPAASTRRSKSCLKDADHLVGPAHEQAADVLLTHHLHGICNGLRGVHLTGAVGFNRDTLLIFRFLARFMSIGSCLAVEGMARGRDAEPQLVVPVRRLQSPFRT